MMKEIKWNELQASKGMAARVPKLLKKMQGKNQDSVEDASLDLECFLVSEELTGKWWPVSAPAMQALFDGIPTSHFPIFNLWVIAEILAAGAIWDKRTAEQLNDEYFKECLSVVNEKRDLIVKALESEDSEIRSGAAAILGSTLGLAGWEQDILEKHFTIETSPYVRSTLLCALELADKSGKWPLEINRIAHEGDTDLLFLGTATLSWLRQDPDHHATEVIKGIESWLSLDIDVGNHNPFLGKNGQVRILSRIISKQEDRSRKNVFSALIEITKTSTNSKVIVRLGNVLQSMLKQSNNVCPVEKLDPDQLYVAKGFADTWIRIGNWIPDSPRLRRRWLGIDNPGILEMPAKEGVDTVVPPRPLWQVLLELYRKCKENQFLPDEIINAYDLKEQWLISLDRYSYGVVCKSVNPDVMTEFMSKLKIDEEMEKIIYSQCDEVLMKRKYSEGYIKGGGPELSRLLLLPLLRSGKSIPEKYYDLVWFNDAPEEREILLSIPQKYIVGVILENLKEADPVTVFSTISEFLPIVDLAPTKEVCEEFVRVRDIMRPDDIEEYGKMLENKAESVSELKRALHK